MHICEHHREAISVPLEWLHKRGVDDVIRHLPKTRALGCADVDGLALAEADELARFMGNGGDKHCRRPDRLYLCPLFSSVCSRRSCAFQ
jgi:hypothetical protein